jgi:hypothetical protein
MKGTPDLRENLERLVRRANDAIMEAVTITRAESDRKHPFLKLFGKD